MPEVLPKGEDLALLAYTSGTTGRAKGAMLLHRNLAANSAAVTQAWRWTAEDCLLLTLPLFHIHGLGVGLHGTLFSGASLVLHERFDAATALQELRSGAITMFFGVPTMYSRLVAESEPGREPRTENPEPGAQSTEHRAQSTEQADESRSVLSVLCSSVRLFVSGSAALSPQLFHAFEARFGQRILERYGMSETVMNLTNPLDGERRPGSVGMPFPDQEARIVDVRTREPLPVDTIGEIEVRGPHVCAGYWRRPDATAEVFHEDGWFSTGDLGSCSADGYYTITGRAKELIISGGYNIYPREVEEALLEHPAVAEAAVFGLPDAEYGEQVVAAVVLRAGSAASEHELIEHCKTRMASYKKPRRIVMIEVLPRNALGKVQKHILAEQLRAEARTEN
jgi:malonyl-CoA/methylmalonyl-CoA synthetase